MRKAFLFTKKMENRLADHIDHIRSIWEELQSSVKCIELGVSGHDIESSLEKYPKIGFTTSGKAKIHLSNKRINMCSESLRLIIVAQNSGYTKIRLLPIPDT